jgi:peptidoglycan/LPS O-acetylase OafA/YrhL
MMDQARSVRTRPASGRLGFLDALRGVAVGLVLVQHVGERLFPAVRELSTHGVQLGQLGVMIFFLCSGFIIPATLERSRSDSRRAGLRAFWRSRFFRLFPLYWLSLLAALLLALAGRRPAGEELAGADWLANLTMLQPVLGAPHAIDVYWTLSLEMVFYLSMALLFALGRHRHSVALSLLASGGCLVAALLAEPVAGRGLPLMTFCLVTMFTGTVFLRWHSGTVGLRTLAVCLLAAAAAGGTLLGTTLAVDGPAEALGARSLVPMAAAWIGAYAVFALGLVLRGRRFPRPLIRLGTISYSVYLVHAVLLSLLPTWASPLVTAIVWGTAILAVSELTHRWVERPAIALGRRRPAPAPPIVPLPAGPRDGDGTRRADLVAS